MFLHALFGGLRLSLYLRQDVPPISFGNLSSYFRGYTGKEIFLSDLLHQFGDRFISVAMVSCRHGF
jgi:hypothetical protein